MRFLLKEDFMSKSLLPILLSAMSLPLTNCGKNDAKKPTLAPKAGFEAKPVPENLPILGTWVSCVPLDDLSDSFGSRIELTFLQSGNASRKITFHTDLTCQTEITGAERILSEGTFSATLPDESGVGSLDAQISSGQTTIRRYDSYKIVDGQLVLTNSEECEVNCEGIAGGSSENRNRDFSDAVTFDPAAP